MKTFLLSLAALAGFGLALPSAEAKDHHRRDHHDWDRHHRSHYSVGYYGGGYYGPRYYYPPAYYYGGPRVVYYDSYPRYYYRRPGWHVSFGF